MPFLLAEILNFQCALYLKGVGSLSYLINQLLPVMTLQVSYHTSIQILILFILHNKKLI